MTKPIWEELAEIGKDWPKEGYVYIRLKRPEGYEDVHPELVMEDAHINPAFEPEVVSSCPSATDTIGPDSAANTAKECA